MHGAVHHCKWYVLVDDDTFVNTAALASVFLGMTTQGRSM